MVILSRPRLGSSQRAEACLVELGQRVGNLVPWCLQLHEDVFVGAESGLALEEAGRDFEPLLGGLGAGWGRAAAPAKRRAIRRWRFQKRRLVGGDEVPSVDEVEVSRPHPEHGGER